MTTALSASGFDAREFSFYGFLPREAKPLREKLEAIRATGVPVFVLYESPHRVTDLVCTIALLWPQAHICACSDLTKRFERLYRGTAPDVCRELQENPHVEKGEYCLVVDVSDVPAPKTADKAAELSARLYLMDRLLDGTDAREAREAARSAGYARNDIYRAMLEIERWLEET